MRWMELVAVAAVVLGLSATAEPSWRANSHADFVRGARNSCLTKQKSEAANSQISRKPAWPATAPVLAGYIADNSKADDLLLAAGDLQRGNPPAWLADLSKEATRYCVANLRDYVKSN